jgi:hypothetical protein
MTGTLEEILTHRAFLTEIIKDPGHDPVASRDDGERLVVPIGTRLRDALAALAPDETSGVAAAWGQTDEFNGAWSAADATQTISQLVSLGRAAATAGDQIYCWMSV